MLSREQAILKLDVDRARCPTWKRLRFILSRGGYGLNGVIARKSPSGKGWHLWIEVTPRPRTRVEVVALQAILGSDPLREAVTLMRAKATARMPAWADNWWNVLYQPSRARSRRLHLKGAQ